MAKHRTGYLFKRNGNYYLRWRSNGKSFTQSLDTRALKEAKKKRARIMAPIAVADQTEVLQHIATRLATAQDARSWLPTGDDKGIAISEAWRAFLADPRRPDAGEGTMRDYRYEFEQWAAWMFKEHAFITRLDQVAIETANHYAAHLLARGMSGNRFNKHVRLLSLMFRTLRRRAGIRENPWEEIKRRQMVQQGRRELTIEELRLVCGQAAGELRLLLAVGIYTGLRLGDCATLRWAEVDLVRKIITRIPNKTATRNPRPVLVPIHPALFTILQAKKRKGEYVLPKTAALYQNNRWLLTQNIQAHFKTCGIRTTRAAGKGRIRPIVEVGFHSLRHTFVSLCRGAGAPLAVVEAIVGHASPAMTRYYTHVGDVAAAAAVALLPEVTSG